MKKKEDVELSIQILVWHKGKKYGGWVDLSEKLERAGGKMYPADFEHEGFAIIDVARRSLQKVGALEYYKDENGTDLIP